ncbi:MAG: pseudouridine synthase [Candidatus Pacearchaeota archaeon]
MTKQRLQKLISSAGICSRRKAEQLIKDGKVILNQKIAKLGNKADPQTDLIIIEGKPLLFERKRYFILYKPKGYETTMFSKFQRKIVKNLIKTKERLYPIGRLDKNSEGLLLLTNDGDFANRVMHPKYKIEKTYYIQVNKPIKNEHLKEIERGLLIEGVKTSPARIHKLSLKEFELTIHEGRNRIIRKMLEKLNYKVERLIRIAIGRLSLGNLKPKQYRELTKKEISLIFKN